MRRISMVALCLYGMRGIDSCVESSWTAQVGQLSELPEPPIRRSLPEQSIRPFRISQPTKGLWVSKSFVVNRIGIEFKILQQLRGGLGLANGSQIVGAIGLSSINLIGIGAVPNPLAEIQLIRNFIAHKNPASLGDIRTKLSAVSCQDVHGYLWGKTTGGVERFAAWMSSLRLIAEAACA